MGEISKLADYSRETAEIVPLKPLVMEVLQSAELRLRHINIPVGYRSKQMLHMHISKRWVVLDGAMLVHRKHGVEKLVSDDQILIPSTEIHAFENVGRIPLKLVEIRTGIYLQDDELIGG